MSVLRSPWIAGALLLAAAVVPAALTIHHYKQREQAQAATPPAVPAAAQPQHAAPSSAAAGPPPSVAADNARRTYEAANLFADCEERASEANPAAGAPDEAYQIDTSGALAAQLDKARNARGARCRMVGPAEYRQIDGMLRLAADQGNRDAQGLLLRRRARTLMAHAQRDDAGGERRQFDPADEIEAKAIASGLERLALEGHLDSIVALDQLLSVPQPSLSDPTRAAAWRLVSRQQFGAPFPAPDKLTGAAEIVDDMDAPDAGAVVALAKSLFDACCAR